VLDGGRELGGRQHLAGEFRGEGHGEEEEEDREGWKLWKLWK
jgi:hypothetical protein